MMGKKGSGSDTTNDSVLTRKQLETHVKNLGQGLAKAQDALVRRIESVRKKDMQLVEEGRVVTTVYNKFSDVEAQMNELEAQIAKLEQKRQQVDGDLDVMQANLPDVDSDPQYCGMRQTLLNDTELLLEDLEQMKTEYLDLVTKTKQATGSDVFVEVEKGIRENFEQARQIEENIAQLEDRLN